MSSRLSSVHSRPFEFSLDIFDVISKLKLNICGPFTVDCRLSKYPAPSSTDNGQNQKYHHE